MNSCPDTQQCQCNMPECTPVRDVPQHTSRFVTKANPAVTQKCHPQQVSCTSLGGTTGASWQIRAAFMHGESSCILALKNPHQSMCPSQSNQQSMCQPTDDEEAEMHCRVVLLPSFYPHKHAVRSIMVLQAAMHCSKVRHMPCWQHPYDGNAPCWHCHTCFAPAAADCAAQRSGCPTPVVMPRSCARAAAHTAHQLHIARLLRHSGCMLSL